MYLKLENVDSPWNRSFYTLVCKQEFDPGCSAVISNGALNIIEAYIFSFPALPQFYMWIRSGTGYIQLLDWEIEDLIKKMDIRFGRAKC